MKFIALFAIVATTSAVKIDSPFGLKPECEYMKSEDGLSCITIMQNCVASTAVPVMEKCPDRQGPQERTDVAPKTPEIISSIPNGDPPAAPAK